MACEGNKPNEVELPAEAVIMNRIQSPNGVGFFCVSIFEAPDPIPGTALYLSGPSVSLTLSDSGLQL